MKALLILTRYQLVILLREPGYWVVSLMLAVLVMLAFGYLATEPMVPRLGLVDLAVNADSERLLEAARETDGLEVSEGSREDELKRLRQGDRWGVVVLSPGFSGSVTGGVEVWTVEDADYERLAVTGIVVQLLKEVSEHGPTDGGVQVDERPLSNDSPVRFIELIAAGQIGMALMFGSLFAASLIGWWRDDGALRRLAVTPISSRQLLGAQLLVFGALSFVHAAILLTMARVLFGVTVRGDYPVLAVTLMAGILAFLTLWYAIVSVVRSGNTANAVSSLLAIAMLIVGGSFLPVEEPAFLKPILEVLPIHHLNSALRAVMNRGEGFTDIAPNLAVLLGWSAGLFLMSSRLFRWTAD